LWPEKAQENVKHETRCVRVGFCCSRQHDCLFCCHLFCSAINHPQCLQLCIHCHSRRLHSHPHLRLRHHRRRLLVVGGCWTSLVLVTVVLVPVPVVFLNSHPRRPRLHPHPRVHPRVHPHPYPRLLLCLVVVGHCWTSPVVVVLIPVPAVFPKTCLRLLYPFILFRFAFVVYLGLEFDSASTRTSTAAIQSPIQSPIACRSGFANILQRRESFFLFFDFLFILVILVFLFILVFGLFFSVRRLGFGHCKCSSDRHPRCASR